MKLKHVQFILNALVLVAMIAFTSCNVWDAKVLEPTVVETAPVAGPKTNMDYQGGKPMRVVLPSIYHPVHKLMYAGFMDACRDLKLYCEPLTMGDVTVEEYVQRIESTVSLGSSGVIINLGAPVLYQPGKDMVAAGFPVVAVHTPISKEDIPGLVAWVSADPAAYAKEAAKEMAEAVQCQGPIAVMQNAQSDTENAVGNGFRDELLVLCPDIVVLETQLEGVEPTKAAAVDAAVLAAHADLKGAFSTTGGGPTSWATALKEAGKEPGDVVVISMDFTRPNLDLVRDGWVYALVAQPIYTEFYHGVELALAKLKGEEVQYENYMEAPIIKLADIGTYYKLNDNAGN